MFDNKHSHLLGCQDILCILITVPFPAPEDYCRTATQHKYITTSCPLVQVKCPANIALPWQDNRKCLSLALHYVNVTLTSTLHVRTCSMPPRRLGKLLQQLMCTLEYFAWETSNEKFAFISMKYCIQKINKACALLENAPLQSANIALQIMHVNNFKS